jgi:hypothetical protein
MSHLRECPDERNKGPRGVVSILLRPAMLDTLKEMHAEAQGTGTFENFLGEHLENIAAEYRAKQWRLTHPTPTKERKAERAGAVYANAAADLQEQEGEV